MKESDSTLPACRNRIKYLLVFDTFARILLFGYIIYLLVERFTSFSVTESLFSRSNETIIERL
jgi:hypothetical protein